MDIEKNIFISLGILLIIYLIYKYYKKLHINRESFAVNKLGKIFSAGEGSDIRLIGLNDGWLFDESWIRSGYRRPSVVKKNGVVYLSGRTQGIGSNTRPSYRTIIGTLPRGYWPDSRLVYHVGPSNGNRIDILKNGSIMYITGKGHAGSHYIDLDPISFTVNKGSQINFNVVRKCYFVRIILPKNGYLSLAEVQVFDKNGKLISKNKPASQSSTGWGGNAGRAVDGNTSGSYGRRSVTHTRRGTNNFWLVDLKGGHDIKNVKVFNRTDCCDGRITGAKIQLLDEGRGEIASKVWDPKDYIDAGKVNTTVSGRRCQNWRSSAPHRHNLRYSSSGGVGNHNYCRNVRGRKVTTTRKILTGVSDGCRKIRHSGYHLYLQRNGRRVGYHRECAGRERWKGYLGSRRQCQARCRGHKYYIYGANYRRCRTRWRFNWRRWKWTRTRSCACYCEGPWRTRRTYRTIRNTRTVYEPNARAPLACFTTDRRVKLEKCAVNGKSNISYRKKIYPSVKNFNFGMTGGSIPSGWRNYSVGTRSGGYRPCTALRVDNFVVLAGLARYQSRQWPVPSVIGILPSDLRPKYTRSFNQTNHNGCVRIQIMQDGRIMVDRGDKYHLARYYGWISLSGIQWPVNYQDNSITLNLSNNVRPANQLADARLLSGAIYKLRNFKGSGRGSGFSAGDSASYNSPGDQTMTMWLNIRQNGRQNPVAKAYGGDGTMTIERNGTVSYYYGRSGRNSGPYIGFHFPKVTFNKPTHVAVTRRNRYVWAYRYVWRWLPVFKKQKFKNVPSSSMPGGSWSRSARSSRMSGSRLTSQLRRRNGSWTTASTTVYAGWTYENINGSFRGRPPPRRARRVRVPGKYRKVRRAIRYRKYVNTTVRGYINGKLKKTKVFKMEPRSGSLPLLVGRGYVNPLRGEMNNLLIFNRAISAEEVFAVKGLTVGEDVNYGPPIAIRNEKLITFSGVLMPNPRARRGSRGGNVHIATLPGHFRPNRVVMFTVNQGTLCMNVYVNDAGHIYFRSSNSNTPTFISLDGLSFLTYK